ncbi:MAG: glycosyltransferase [Lachnospiraceae bacterium]|nr:glycosyltransferase [Lachnospiraceae bacterium]
MSKELIHSNIKLTIGMLVSNHIDYIRNCMDSVKPLLDAVPSELIIIDTKGSETDGSIEIAKEYTDKIFPFTWCNDFSAARNEIIRHANGEWLLYFDDDEWFDDVTEFIEFFTSNDCEKYNSGWYYTRDYDDEGNYSMGIAGRMIRLRKDTHFVGKVHERFNEVYLPNKQFSCFTHHYGYAFRTLEDAQKHRERNVSILKQEIAEQGLTPVYASQMVQELIYLEDSTDEGYRFAKESLGKFPKAYLTDSCLQWIIMATVRYHCLKSSLDDAKQELLFVENNYPLTEVTTLALMGLMTCLASQKESATDTLHYATRYLDLYKWTLAHPEETMYQLQMDFAHFTREEYYYRILFLGNEASKKIKELQKTEKHKELASLLGLLEAAGRELKTLLSSGQTQTLTDYLQSMQETAICLGTSLDNFYGEGLTTVTLLEQYCELLYACSQADTIEKALSVTEELLLLSNNIKTSFDAEILIK